MLNVPGLHRWSCISCFQDARKACADATLSQVTVRSLKFSKAGKKNTLIKSLMFYRSPLISTLSGESRCVQEEHCGDIWLKSMPCTGAPIPGRITHLLVICQYLFPFFVWCLCTCLFQAPGQCLSRWKTHYLGQLYYKQGRFGLFIKRTIM